MILEFADLCLQRHESLAHLLDLFLGKRSTFHAADCLALQQLSQQFNQAKDELGQTLLDRLLIALDSRRRACGCGAPIYGFDVDAGRISHHFPL